MKGSHKNNKPNKRATLVKDNKIKMIIKVVFNCVLAIGRINLVIFGKVRSAEDVHEWILPVSWSVVEPRMT